MTRRADFSSFRCCETAGRLTGRSTAISPTARGRSRPVRRSTAGSGRRAPSSHPQLYKVALTVSSCLPKAGRRPRRGQRRRSVQVVSRSFLSGARSLRLARRIARAMNGAATFENPAGSPRLRRSSGSRCPWLRSRCRWSPSGTDLRRCASRGGRRHVLDELVGVLEPAAEEPSDERDPGTDSDRGFGLPFDRVDVAYHSARWAGRWRNAATTATGRSITISVTTSTVMASSPSFFLRLPSAEEPPPLCRPWRSRFEPAERSNRQAV